MKPVGKPFHNPNDYKDLSLRRRTEGLESNPREASRHANSMGMNALLEALPARSNRTEERSERDSRSYSSNHSSSSGPRHTALARSSSSTATRDSGISAHSSMRMKAPQDALPPRSDRTET